MSYTLEVKPGRTTRGVVWLDLTQFKVVRNGTNSLLLMSADGTQCFSILKGKRRKQVLESLGYDADAIWESQEVQQ